MPLFRILDFRVFLFVLRKMYVFGNGLFGGASGNKSFGPHWAPMAPHGIPMDHHMAAMGSDRGPHGSPWVPIGHALAISSQTCRQMQKSCAPLRIPTSMRPRSDV